MIQMVRKSLKDKLNPKKPPAVFTTEKTTTGFIHQVMMIIHPFYYDNKKRNPMSPWDRLEISEYSHEIISEYCKHRRDCHLHVNEEFDVDALYVRLEKSKNMEFFELLNYMVQVLYDETRKSGRGYRDYLELTKELNESMRQNGIGYQIIDGEMIIQTEPKVFEEITAPCLIALTENGFYEADRFIDEAFKIYKEGTFEEAVIDACKALENVVFELCQRKELPITPKDNFPKMIRSLLKDEDDITNQLGEHSDSLYHLMQTAETIRNENAAHGKVVKNISSSMARYVIDIVCSDILFLVRYFCEEKED